MKINDIYTNLKKVINLNKFERYLGVVNEIDDKKNIDSLGKKLDNVNIGSKIKLSISKYKNKIFDGSDIKKVSKNIDLKNIIKNSRKFKYIILNFFSKLHFNYKNKNKFFKISFYIVLIFSIILLNKIIIQNLVFSGIENLYNLKYVSNVSEANIQLSKAKTKFNIANILFIPFKIIPEQHIINSNNGIKVLQNISQIGLDSIEYYNKNIDFINNKKITDIYFANLLENSKPFFVYIEKKISIIDKSIDKINLKDKKSINSIKLERLKKYINYSYNKISYLNNNFDTFLNILGKDRAKKYMIVFQNNDEIRPTGGFMGSAGVVEIFSGKIKNIEKRDIYAYEWDVKKNYIENLSPPTGIHIFGGRFNLRDANAFINYETSSKSINYFMKKAGYDLDGIIYINQKIIIDILENIGEIDFQKYDTKITKENFSEIISLLVEAKVSKKGTLDTPKQVLFDFSNLFKDKILKDKKYIEVLKATINNLKSRDLVFYSFNKTENDFLKYLGVTGDFNYKNQTDFNYPFFISVGGNKSDRYIKRKYIKDVKIIKNTDNDLCTLKANFDIILQNSFSEEDKKRIIENMKKFRIKPTDDLINIAGKGLNQNYTKVVIPRNAMLNEKLLKKYSYDFIYHDKYTTIEKLLKTLPSDKSYFSFSYIIKNIDCYKQNFMIYKQAGIYKYDIDFYYNNEVTGKKESLKLAGLEQDFYYNNKN